MEELAKDFEEFIDGRIEAACLNLNENEEIKTLEKDFNLFFYKLKKILNKKQYPFLIEILDRLGAINLQAGI